MKKRPGLAHFLKKAGKKSRFRQSNATLESGAYLKYDDTLDIG